MRCLNSIVPEYHEKMALMMTMTEPKLPTMLG